jgi:hypothetical protein
MQFFRSDAAFQNPQYMWPTVFRRTIGLYRIPLGLGLAMILSSCGKILGPWDSGPEEPYTVQSNLVWEYRSEHANSTSLSARFLKRVGLDSTRTFPKGDSLVSWFSTRDSGYVYQSRQTGNMVWTLVDSTATVLSYRNRCVTRGGMMHCDATGAPSEILFIPTEEEGNYTNAIVKKVPAMGKMWTLAWLSHTDTYLYGVGYLRKREGFISAHGAGVTQTYTLLRFDGRQYEELLAMQRPY